LGLWIKFNPELFILARWFFSCFSGKTLIPLIQQKTIWGLALVPDLNKNKKLKLKSGKITFISYATWVCSIIKERNER
jgi:hypothetical protein